MIVSASHRVSLSCHLFQDVVPADISLETPYPALPIFAAVVPGEVEPFVVPHWMSRRCFRFPAHAVGGSNTNAIVKPPSANLLLRCRQASVLVEQSQKGRPMLCCIEKHRRSPSRVKVASPCSLPLSLLTLNIITRHNHISRQYHTPKLRHATQPLGTRHNARNSNYTDHPTDLRHHCSWPIRPCRQLARNRLGPYHDCLLCLRWRIRHPRLCHWSSRHMAYGHP